MEGGRTELPFFRSVSWQPEGLPSPQEVCREACSGYLDGPMETAWSGLFKSDPWAIFRAIHHSDCRNPKFSRLLFLQYRKIDSLYFFDAKGLWR